MAFFDRIAVWSNAKDDPSQPGSCVAPPVGLSEGDPSLKDLSQYEWDDDEDDDEGLEHELAVLNRQLMLERDAAQAQVEKLLEEDKRISAELEQKTYTIRNLEDELTRIQNDCFVLEGLNKANRELESRTNATDELNKRLADEKTKLASRVRLLQAEVKDYEQEVEQWEEERKEWKKRLALKVDGVTGSSVLTGAVDEIDEERSQMRQQRRLLSKAQREAEELSLENAALKEQIAEQAEQLEEQKMQLAHDSNDVQLQRRKLDVEMKALAEAKRAVNRRSEDLDRERRSLVEGKRRFRELQELGLGSPADFKLHEQSLRLTHNKNLVDFERMSVAQQKKKMLQTQAQLEQNLEQLKRAQMELEEEKLALGIDASGMRALPVEYTRELEVLHQEMEQELMEKAQIKIEESIMSKQDELEMENTKILEKKVKDLHDELGLDYDRRVQNAREEIEGQIKEMLKEQTANLRDAKKKVGKDQRSLNKKLRKLEIDREHLDEEKELILKVKTTKLSKAQLTWHGIKKSNDRLNRLNISLGGLPVEAFVSQNTLSKNKDPVSVELSIQAQNLISLNSDNAIDPLVALLGKNSKGKFTRLISQTEWIRGQNNPKFQEKFIIPLQPGGASNNNIDLRFSVYDVESKKLTESGRMGSVDIKLIADILSKPAHQALVFPVRHKRNTRRAQRLLSEGTQLTLSYRLIRKTKKSALGEGKMDEVGSIEPKSFTTMEAEIDRLERLANSLCVQVAEVGKQDDAEIYSESDTESVAGSELKVPTTQTPSPSGVSYLDQDGTVERVKIKIRATNVNDFGLNGQVLVVMNNPTGEPELLYRSSIRHTDPLQGTADGRIKLTYQALSAANRIKICLIRESADISSQEALCKVLRPTIGADGKELEDEDYLIDQFAPDLLAVCSFWPIQLLTAPYLSIPVSHPFVRNIHKSLVKENATVTFAVLPEAKNVIAAAAAACVNTIANGAIPRQDDVHDLLIRENSLQAKMAAIEKKAKKQRQDLEERLARIENAELEHNSNLVQNKMAIEKEKATIHTQIAAALESAEQSYGVCLSMASSTIKAMVLLLKQYQEGSVILDSLIKSKITKAIENFCDGTSKVSLPELPEGSDTINEYKETRSRRTNNQALIDGLDLLLADLATALGDFSKATPDVKAAQVAADLVTSIESKHSPIPASSELGGQSESESSVRQGQEATEIEPTRSTPPNEPTFEDSSDSEDFEEA